MDDDLSTFFWIAAGAFAAITLFAAWADHRRANRRDVDRPGCMPWTLILVMAILLALVSTALAVLV